jgi:hypothetical protein
MEMERERDGMGGGAGGGAFGGEVEGVDIVRTTGVSRSGRRHCTRALARLIGSYCSSLLGIHPPGARSRAVPGARQFPFSPNFGRD